MALPGLNIEGTNIRVLPQYTPSNTALDFSTLGQGFSQGMGLVRAAQDTRRLRDIMAEETARRPLRDLMAEEQMATARDSLSYLPERQRLRGISDTRRLYELQQPVKETISEFTDELPGGGGVGRYQVNRYTNPITGQVEEFNEFVGQVASAEEVAAQQEQAAFNREVKLADLDYKREQTLALGREKQPPVFKGETVDIMENGVPVKYAVNYDARGTPTLGNKLGQAVARQPETMFNFRDEFGGGATTPAVAPRVSDVKAAIPGFLATGARAQAPATQAGASTVSFRVPLAPGDTPAAEELVVNEAGLPNFQNEAQYEAALNAGLIKVGDRIVIAGQQFDVQE